MSLALYMDHHVRRAITEGLRTRSVDVLTALEDGADRFLDADLLDGAATLNRLLFSQDDDLLAEAAMRQRTGIPSSGLVYAHQLRVSVGVCIRDLELIAKVGEPSDIENIVMFLPL